jgi:hypothetical protein
MAPPAAFVQRRVVSTTFHQLKTQSFFSLHALHMAGDDFGRSD